MKKERENEYPRMRNGFFTKQRETISNAESFRDITPFELPKEVLNGEKKIHMV